MKNVNKHRLVLVKYIKWDLTNVCGGIQGCHVHPTKTMYVWKKKFFFLVNFMENVNKHRLVVVKSIKNIAVNGHRKVPVNTTW